jgi:DNA-binding MarR family transcriptional regulator
MRLLAENEGTSQQALGEKLSIPASRMVALLDDLEERHLLERRPNPTDRRARALHLTDKGRQLLANTLGAAVRYEQEIAAPLTMDERAQLAQLLRRLAVHHHLVIDVHPALTLDDERCRPEAPSRGVKEHRG